MNKFRSKIKNSVRSMKLRERMLLIYFIAGFIPILLIIGYINNSLADIQMSQVLDATEKRLSIEAERESGTMNMAVELSEKIHYDSKTDKLVVDKYIANRELRVDYHNYEDLDALLTKYYPDIETITVYLPERVVEGKQLIDNRYFNMLTSTVLSKDWAIRANAANGDPSWSYVSNGTRVGNNYRMSRLLYNENGTYVGIISYTLKHSVGGDFIQESASEEDNITFVFHNNTTIVNSSDDITEAELNYINECLREGKAGKEIQFRGDKCILAIQKVYPRNARENYTIISIDHYENIISASRKQLLKSYLPLLIGAAFMIVAIFLMMSWYSRRLRSLVRAMRRVTYGNYNVEDTEIEKYYDEVFDLYSTLKTLVGDMQNLQELAAKERIQKEQMYSRQKDVEFKMLATQINPHFLYNTLENIRMMASINGEKNIADMSFNLTKLLRKTLSAGKGLKSLLWEMEMVENYITIQNYRFGERIRAVIDYDKNQAVDYQIIPFVVQPFVENAYVHAMESMEEGGVISISADIGEDLILVIEDNGCGMSKEKLEEVTKYLNDFENIDRTHIGIVNVNQRIKLQFGDDYGVDFKSEEGKGTRVEIKMPLIENES